MGDQETTENFWRVWNSFQWPEPKPVFYRCYYLEDGTPDFYTMEDLPGSWIEVTKEVYLLSPRNARVVDGQLQIFEVKKTVTKLKPNQTQGIDCDPRDICLVIEKGIKSLKWEKCQNEID